MPDYSDHKPLTVGTVILNIAARGWAAAGLGAALGFFLLDVWLLITDGEFLLTNIGLIVSCGLYMVLPGGLLSGAIALVRRFFLPRLVWGNAHWIFPAIAALGAVAVALGVGIIG